MAKRTYPNDNFAWYNDDDRLAILCEDNESVSGERTTERYDTFQGTGDLSGTITNMITDGSTVTVTCSAAHSLASNDRIAISGTRHYDGNYSITETSSTTFTFSSSAVGGTADTVSDLDVVSGTATVTTSAAHGYSVGDVVYIDESTDAYDEEVTIASVPGATSFTYTTSKSDTTNKTGTVGDTGSFVSLFINNGIRITYHSKYGTIDAQTEDLKTEAGLDSGLHPMVVCYIKARMFEDAGDLERASYFRQMYEKGVHQYPLRKSGVRALSVPKI
tara:strand:+ start:268 stop:1092 length:825 start_codon:yes stop_codon:yes gene_type:complete